MTRNHGRSNGADQQWIRHCVIIELPIMRQHRESRGAMSSGEIRHFSYKGEHVTLGRDPADSRDVRQPQHYVLRSKTMSEADKIAVVAFYKQALMEGDVENEFQIYARPTLPHNIF